MNCHIYYSVKNNEYMLSTKIETESEPIPVDLDEMYESKVIYYAHMFVLEGYDTIQYASNNKRNVCEFIYNWLDLSEDNGNVYYCSGEIYTCSQCELKTKKDVLKCLSSHKSDEVQICVI
jgi:hypothetical protein